MLVAIPKETVADETRVAATPETVKKFVALGAGVRVQSQAGLTSGILDADYEAAGATVIADAAGTLADADIVLKVRRPAEAEIPLLKRGAIVIGTLDPYGHDDAVRALAEAGVIAFATELTPRITRAQVMDVLSSQANLAGYRAVIDAAAEYGRALPMMMTAAGTVPAARIFVMGAGVAGLQAIATARRLGAIVTATDVRPAAKEQVNRSALNLLRWKTTSSSKPRLRAATLARCRTSISANRPSSSRPTSPSRILSSPRHLSRVVRRLAWFLKPWYAPSNPVPSLLTLPWSAAATLRVRGRVRS